MAHAEIKGIAVDSESEVCLIFDASLSEGISKTARAVLLPISIEIPVICPMVFAHGALPGSTVPVSRNASRSPILIFCS